MDCTGSRGFDVADHAGELELHRSSRPASERRLETELQFLTRRAMEESRLAKQASTPRAAAAHSYLAAAYAAQVAKELAKEAELEELLHRLN